MIEPPPRVYARHLLPFGCGYPLWTPELGNQFLRYRRDGLRIGDVGVIVPENGSFDVFFNICLPREHPFHRVNGVPDNFVQVNLDELDVAIYPYAENPGSVISTSSVTTLRTVEPPDGAGHQNALTYEFNLSSSEGALLILPEGAESYTLLKRQVFRDLATRNGVEWYNFAEQQLGRIISHDSLYLITGCYKSHSWSVAAFHEASSRTGDTEFPAQFKAGQARQGNISASYTCETARALHWRIGPLGDWNAIPNQAVFVSGFKIAIRDNILGRKRVEVEVDAPPTHIKPPKLHSSGRGRSRAGKIWRRLVSKSSGERVTGEQAEADSANDAGVAADGSLDVGGHVTVTHIPETLRSFHPSDIVNRYLLTKESSATVAVTHDSQWSILFEKGILKPEDLGDDGRLENIVSENYRMVSQDGVVCLQTLSDSSIRLTDINDTVREAWKDDKLDDAEEILSMQIIRRAGSDHSVFANRALIRARLRHWDAALRDAETSIDIQPSVTAHVAKGFALFGQQKYASAVHAFNVALRGCDAHDKVFVSLVKSIVLFEVGYHAESMAGIADLIEYSPGPAEVKSACSVTQVEMYVRLATLATKKEDYDRALQLLSHAQSLGSFQVVPELEIIFLICGWRFDNLQFSTYREKCKVLYVAGRIHEAVKLLQTMTRDLGEDARTRQDNAGWIITFTQKCLQSLEGLGDSALASQNYVDAISYYSATLSLGPAIRESILVKRSNAYAAVGAWNDALNDADEVIALNPLSPWGHERKLAALQCMGRNDEAIQAFNSMLSTLERFQQLRSDHTGQTMATQGIGPRLQTHHHRPPLHNLDHKGIIESIIKDTKDVDSQRAAEMLGLLRAERDEMVRERDALRSANQLGHLEQQLHVGAMNVDPAAGFTASNEPLHEQMTTSERYQKLHDQVTDLVRQTREDDKQAPELMKMMLRLAEQQLRLRPQQDEQSNLLAMELLGKLQMYNAKQRELLDVLSSYWRKDATGSKGKQQERGSDTDHEQLPFSFQSLREDFINALAKEARMIVEEIAKLGEERCRLQQELGHLMMMTAKYGPGGEFEPDWNRRPPPPPPPPPGIPEKMSGARSQKWPTTAPPAKSTGPGNIQNIRPAWRSVEPVLKQRRPTVEPIRLESGSIGLLGPSTPRKTSLLDVETTLEPNLIATEVDSKTGMMARPASPSETLSFKFEHDDLTSLSSSHAPLPKRGLNRSSPKFTASSAPSPLSFESPPLNDSKSEIPKKPALNMIDAGIHGVDDFGGAIDI